MAILNLDVFEEKIEEVQLKGKIYKIPSDIPTAYFLKLLEAKDKDPAKGMKEGIEIMHKIFQIYQPKLTYEEFELAITNDKYAAVINFLFAGMSIEETQALLEETKQQIKDGKKKPVQVEN